MAGKVNLKFDDNQQLDNVSISGQVDPATQKHVQESLGWEPGSEKSADTGQPNRPPVMDSGQPSEDAQSDENNPYHRSSPHETSQDGLSPIPDPEPNSIDPIDTANPMASGDSSLGPLPIHQDAGMLGGPSSPPGPDPTVNIPAELAAGSIQNLYGPFSESPQDTSHVLPPGQADPILNELVEEQQSNQMGINSGPPLDKPRGFMDEQWAILNPQEQDEYHNLLSRMQNAVDSHNQQDLSRSVSRINSLQNKMKQGYEMQMQQQQQMQQPVGGAPFMKSGFSFSFEKAIGDPPNAPMAPPSMPKAPEPEPAPAASSMAPPSMPKTPEPKSAPAASPVAPMAPPSINKAPKSAPAASPVAPMAPPSMTPTTSPALGEIGALSAHGDEPEEPESTHGVPQPREGVMFHGIHSVPGKKKIEVPHPTIPGKTVENEVPDHDNPTHYTIHEHPGGSIIHTKWSGHRDEEGNYHQNHSLVVPLYHPNKHGAMSGLSPHMSVTAEHPHPGQYTPEEEAEAAKAGEPIEKEPEGHTIARWWENDPQQHRGGTWKYKFVDQKNSDYHGLGLPAITAMANGKMEATHANTSGYAEPGASFGYHTISTHSTLRDEAARGVAGEEGGISPLEAYRRTVNKLRDSDDPNGAGSAKWAHQDKAFPDRWHVYAQRGHRDPQKHHDDGEQIGHQHRDEILHQVVPGRPEDLSKVNFNPKKADRALPDLASNTYGDGPLNKMSLEQYLHGLKGTRHGRAFRNPETLDEELLSHGGAHVTHDYENQSPENTVGGEGVPKLHQGKIDHETIFHPETGEKMADLYQTQTTSGRRESGGVSTPGGQSWVIHEQPGHKRLTAGKESNLSRHGTEWAARHALKVFDWHDSIKSDPTGKKKIFADQNITSLFDGTDEDSTKAREAYPVVHALQKGLLPYTAHSMENDQGHPYRQVRPDLSARLPDGRTYSEALMDEVAPIIYKSANSIADSYRADYDAQLPYAVKKKKADANGVVPPLSAAEEQQKRDHEDLMTAAIFHGFNVVQKALTIRQGAKKAGGFIPGQGPTQAANRGLGNIGVQTKGRIAGEDFEAGQGVSNLMGYIKTLLMAQDSPLRDMLQDRGNIQIHRKRGDTISPKDWEKNHRELWKEQVRDAYVQSVKSNLPPELHDAADASIEAHLKPILTRDQATQLYRKKDEPIHPGIPNSRAWMPYPRYVKELDHDEGFQENVAPQDTGGMIDNAEEIARRGPDQWGDPDAGSDRRGDIGEHLSYPQIHPIHQEELNRDIKEHQDTNLGLDPNDPDQKKEVFDKFIEKLGHGLYHNPAPPENRYHPGTTTPTFNPMSMDYHRKAAAPAFLYLAKEAFPRPRPPREPHPSAGPREQEAYKLKKQEYDEKVKNLDQRIGKLASQWSKAAMIGEDAFLGDIQMLKDQHNSPEGRAQLPAQQPQSLQDVASALSGLAQGKGEEGEDDADNFGYSAYLRRKKEDEETDTRKGLSSLDRMTVAQAMAKSRNNIVKQVIDDVAPANDVKRLLIIKIIKGLRTGEIVDGPDYLVKSIQNSHGHIKSYVGKSELEPTDSLRIVLSWYGELRNHDLFKGLIWHVQAEEAMAKSNHQYAEELHKSARLAFASYFHRIQE